MSEIMVRGTPIEALRTFLRQELSPEQLAAVIARLSSREFAKQISTTIIPSELFPLTHVNELTALAADEKGEPPDAFARRAGSFSAGLSLGRPAFRPFFAVLSVANALRVAPLMWKRVYTGGVMEVTAQSHGARIVVTQFPGSVAGCGRITGFFHYIGEKS